MTADHWCGTLTCGSSEQTSKQKELKKIHVKREKGALGSNRHTSLAVELIALNSPVRPFDHPCGIICPWFGQDGVFTIPQKRRPWEPAPSCRPALGHALSVTRRHRGWRDSCRPADGHREAGWGRKQPSWDGEGKASRKRDEKQHGFVRGESDQSRQLSVKNTVTLGDKSAELASSKCHFPARHLGII